ncbi:cobalt ECF transporter T component CbiQ [Neptunomonas sp. XY-337]|uniref:cobalt ECF transporter T component CbiQ n=1 Tax=Neptunomonas sp. XY-337 TaxID=2561897 RepID=UPI0010AA2529|nr:cobalt ECF transporter T component CbiQ [Neptunomonas sp. XY-337]
MSAPLEHSGFSWRGQALRHGSSRLDRIEPRARILALVSFAFVAVLSQALSVLVMALLMSVSLAVFARLDIKRVWRRILAVDLFILLLLVSLPFTTSGEPVFEWRQFSASEEGLMHALQIGLKANAVLLAGLTLLGTLSANQLGTGLAGLRVPEKLVHLMLFSVRYMDVIGRELKKMRRAMRARGFVARTNWHTWRATGYLIGMLFVRSLDRAERVHKAMKCRGFDGRFFLLPTPPWQPRDSYFLGVWLLALAALCFGGLQ